VNAPAAKPAPKKAPLTLAAVVGAGVAVALGVAIPADESGRKVEATIAPTGELKVKHISGKQYLSVYLDIVKVPTACDGLTRDEQGRRLQPGAYVGEARCAAMLERALVAHAVGVMSCSPGLAISPDPAIERRREGPRFAAVSLGYNVGVGAYCTSTVRARFNAGAYAAGCDRLLAWNKAGGRPVRGLTLRRQRERAVCLNGLGAVK
jgi:lysozyme